MWMLPQKGAHVGSGVGNGVGSGVNSFGLMGNKPNSFANSFVSGLNLPKKNITSPRLVKPCYSMDTGGGTPSISRFRIT